MKMISLVVLTHRWDTKFFKGPIINAMEKAAVALLDELDLANLQSNVLTINS